MTILSASKRGERAFIHENSLWFAFNFITFILKLKKWKELFSELCWLCAVFQA